ncbi:MAG: mechanosensitive ion channel [Flavobacteriales bacterium]|jgi:small conductance mechanosensitive channel|nr:mechanosensitive ion channel [Flavobacteriales bacterium]MBK6551933.1 mechanosensitive ion channel [Flavobacteriales bacterium]MBK6883421.1 mechanosensitive ion channel [Flavobacteriales bacterium]MBK7620791.1 mechanosensitive ion channel [Flavobacteriales bacterium]MBK8531145.1 mechanosensitive ion channel [Flavobacteriales bacterium]
MTTSEGIRLVEEKLFDWIKTFIQMLPNVMLAALIVVIAWLLARLARYWSKRLVAKMTDSLTLRRLIGNSVYLLVVLIGLFGALSILHLDKTVTSILAGAGIIGLALGFAFQDIAANFISGITMAAQRPIRVGELIGTNDHIGTVERIDLRTTELRDLQGIQIIIPNKDIFQSVLMNYTRHGIRRVDIVVGVSYGDDLQKAELVTIEAVRSVPERLQDHEVELYYQGFGDSSIDLEVRFWINATSNAHYNDMRSRAIKAIKSAYDREGITIPFPIRTLDFGIKGGQKLDAMLSERPVDRH